MAITNSSREWRRLLLCAVADELFAVDADGGDADVVVVVLMLLCCCCCAVVVDGERLSISKYTVSHVTTNQIVINYSVHSSTILYPQVHNLYHRN